MSSSKKKWPIEPLQRAVDTACVVRQLASIGTLAMSAGYSKAKAEKVADLYRTGMEEGLITLRTLDTICIDILGVHPIEVYGWDYFNPEYDCVAVGKPCRGCKGPKEPGRLHYCSTCRPESKERLCACGCGEPKSSDRAQYAHRSHSPKYGQTAPGRRSPRTKVPA